MAREWDGTTSNYARIANNAAFEFGTGAFSISAWVWPDNPTSTDEKHIVRKDAGAGNRGLFVFRLQPVTGVLDFEVGNVISFPANFTQVLGSTGFTADTWDHAGAVRNRVADTISVYKSGVSDATSVTDLDGDVSVTAGSLGIGGWYADDTTGIQTASLWDGYLAEIGIWNVALTAAEMAILGKGYSPLHVQPGNLVVYMPILGNYSPELEYATGLSPAITGTLTKQPHPRTIYPYSSQGRRFTTAVAAAGGNQWPVFQQRGFWNWRF